MERKRVKRTAAGWIAAFLSFVVLVTTLSIGIYYLDRENRQNRLRTENLYQESMYSMSESLSNIEVNLSKILVSNDNLETALMLNDTYHHSQAAITALNLLPVSAEDRAACDKFLNQLGDWCNSQVKALLGGGSNEAGDEQVIVANATGQNEQDKTSQKNQDSFGENLDPNQQGFDQASQDGQNILPDSNQNEKNIDDLNMGGNQQDMPQNSSGRMQLDNFDEQCEELYIRARRLNLSVKDAAARIDGSYRMLHNLSDGIMTDFDINDTILKNSTDVPELIYDGPFSDSQSLKRFKGLEGKEEISQDKAKEIAKEIFKEIGFRNITVLGETSEPPAYSLIGNTNKPDKDMYVSISKNGGVILSASLPCDNSGKTQRLEQDKAVELAQKYATMCGYEGLSPVWYNEIDKCAVVNLTPEVNGVIFYPDLVKVKVCLVTGDFAGIEAVGYCKSHYQREFSAEIDEMQASKAVSSKLNINGIRLAVVPKDMTERLCYEFAAQYKGLDYFVYVDAKTGKQINIMRVIDEEQGQMVM